MTLSDLNHEISKAQANYNQKVDELYGARARKQDAEIDLIRADGAYQKAKLEVTVAKSKIDTLREQSWNLRQEAKI